MAERKSQIAECVKRLAGRLAWLAETGEDARNQGWACGVTWSVVL